LLQPDVMSPHWDWRSAPASASDHGLL